MVARGIGIGHPTAATRIALREAPLSFWLRHAHRFSFAPNRHADEGELRTSDDWMLMLPLERDSWIWWGPGEGSVALPVGSAALIPPGIVHAHSWHPGHHYAIHFDLQAQPRIVSPRMLHPTGGWVRQRPLAAAPRFTLHRSGPGADMTFAVVTALAAPEEWFVRCERLSHLFGTRTHGAVSAAIETADILAWMLRALELPAPDADRSDRAQQVLSLLARLGDADLADPQPLPQLARSAGMGRTAFWSAVVAATGLTPRRWLEQRRMEAAARRLRDTGRTVADIAAEVGFADPFHFSRAFKRVIGASPRDYRRRAEAMAQ
jgi:AraC-like DNA-binding protein